MQTKKINLIRRIFSIGLLVSLIINPFANALALASNTILYDFSGGSNDGAKPDGSLIKVGDRFYGVTQRGGDYNSGTIFSIKTDGTDFRLVYNFKGSISGFVDGEYPFSSLLLSGVILYGVTEYGGINDWGSLFSIETDGSDYQLLHSADVDGKFPSGQLIKVEGKLYGMMNDGGSRGSGNVYVYDLDSATFSVLHEFTSEFDDGCCALYGGLVHDNGILYGVTGYGGSGSDEGIIFSIRTDGSDFTLLHDFSGDDGKNPHSSLIIDGDTLYGTTYEGGENNKGVIFSIKTDGTDFTSLHEFSDHDGSRPLYWLIQDESYLYGTASEGGEFNEGVVYMIAKDGSDFTILHDFDSEGEVNDGRHPYGPLLKDGVWLYGMTYEGGKNDLGTIYSILNDKEKPVLTVRSIGTTTDTVSQLIGTVEDEGLIASVTYQFGTTTGEWIPCVASDGKFNTAIESFTCSFGRLAIGTYTVYVRAEDMSGNYAITSDTFVIQGKRSTSGTSVRTQIEKMGSYGNDSRAEELASQYGEGSELDLLSEVDPQRLTSGSATSSELYLRISEIIKAMPAEGDLRRQPALAIELQKKLLELTSLLIRLRDQLQVENN
jgi:uncharacterized repeat protein (TIGR03803 family)